MCYSLGARLPWALSFAFYHGKGQLTMNNEELAMAIKTGERDKLLPLWDQVRRFAYQQARRWAAAGRGGITVEDLEQESFLALLDALERWRPWWSGTRQPCGMRRYGKRWTLCQRISAG